MSDEFTGYGDASATQISTPSGGTVPGLTAAQNAINLASQVNSAAPWDNLDPTRFFFPITIDGLRWNQAYPYRFVVINTANNNIIVNGNTNTDITITPMDSGGVLTFQPVSPTWAIQLPITPEQLNITDQYAIATSATLRGVLVA